MPDPLSPHLLIGVIAILSAGYLAALIAAFYFHSQARRWRLRSAVLQSRANVRLRLLRSVWGRKVGPEIDGATAGRILAILCSQSEAVRHGD
jgi:hypothetical protein